MYYPTDGTLGFVRVTRAPARMQDRDPPPPRSVSAPRPPSGARVAVRWTPDDAVDPPPPVAPRPYVPRYVPPPRRPPPVVRPPLQTGCAICGGRHRTQDHPISPPVVVRPPPPVVRPPPPVVRPPPPVVIRPPLIHPPPPPPPPVHRPPPVVVPPPNGGFRPPPIERPPPVVVVSVPPGAERPAEPRPAEAGGGGALSILALVGAALALGGGL